MRKNFSIPNDFFCVVSLFLCFVDFLPSSWRRSCDLVHCINFLIYTVYDELNLIYETKKKLSCKKNSNALSFEEPVSTPLILIDSIFHDKISEIFKTARLTVWMCVSNVSLCLFHQYFPTNNSICLFWFNQSTKEAVWHPQNTLLIWKSNENYIW